MNKEWIETALAVFSSATKVESASAVETFENGKRRFAKFFLISDAENLKKWQVTPESIPRRINTFIGMPFVSEPKLAHFGADNMPLDAILTKQEQYRAGTIIDVQFNPNNNQSFAIVEFLDNALGNATWSELQQGKAVYVSPAVAGNGTRTAGGVNLFTDWIGIHLARVSSPAYGVFHASIKSSCEGGERECIRNLLASASMFISSNDSFNIEGFSCSSNMQTIQSQTNTSTAMDDKEEMKKEMASIRAEIASLKTAYQPIGGQNNPDTKPVSNPTTDGQTTPVTDKIVDPQNTSVGSADIQAMKTQLAHYEKKAVASLTQTYVDMKATAGMYETAAEMEEDKKKFGSATEEEMEKEIASITPFVQKMASLNETFGRIGNSSNRVISQVASASNGSSKPTSLEDLRKRGLID